MNKNLVYALRRNGFKVKVTHKRYYKIAGKACLSAYEFNEVYGEQLTVKSVFREPLPHGGQTEVSVITPKGDMAITVAHCNDSDSYCRAIGRELALTRALEKLNLTSQSISISRLLKQIETKMREIPCTVH